MSRVGKVPLPTLIMQGGTMITVQSFSYRLPQPEVLQGFVFDCRMLVNPGCEERFRVKAYGRKGHTNLTASFGCMGGQHRSVYCAELLANWLRTSMHVHVAVRHPMIDGKGSDPVHCAKGGRRTCEQKQ